MELRIRVRKSATGSVRFIHSPSSPVRSRVFARTSGDVCYRYCIQTSASKAVARMRSLGVRTPAKGRTWSGTSILPARLHNARNFSLKGERAEAEAADAELTKESTRAAAELAAIVLPGLKLRLPCIFYALCSSCHISSSLSFQTCLGAGPEG